MERGTSFVLGHGKAPKRKPFRKDILVPRTFLQAQPERAACSTQLNPPLEAHLPSMVRRVRHGIAWRKLIGVSTTRTHFLRELFSSSA
jgi:hypothetical protein